MTLIKAVVRNGRINIPAPKDWPEGCEVVIEPVPGVPTQGMREGEWPTTPEGIALLLKRWDQHEPLVMTPEEAAEWEAALKDQKEYEKAKFNERAQRMEGMWE